MTAGENVSPSGLPPRPEQRLRLALAMHASGPPDPAILREICHALIALQRDDELLPWAEQGLTLGPRDADFLAMRASALNLLGRHAEAADAWSRVPVAPGVTAPNQLRIGYARMMAGDLPRAIRMLDDARRAAAPDNAQLAAQAEHYLGEAMLKAGDPRGFTHWLMRNDDPSAAASYVPDDVPAWRGEHDLQGRRVLITHQLGFGDNFLLAACLADWVSAGAQVMITCDAQAHALMQASLPDCEVVGAERPSQLRSALPEAARSRVDAFAPHLYATLLHLPLMRAAQATSAYRFRPYLQAPLAKRRIAAQWARQLRAAHPGKRLVGVFWDCMQRHQPELGSRMRCWAARRSMPVDAINRIAAAPTVADHVHFVNLHHPLVATYAGIPTGNVSPYLPGIWHFDDTAACIGELDAVIAVDSAVANLAAMMAKPTCVPVNTSADWRWGSRGTSSPWIGNATVLRQRREGDWTTVVQDLTTWLR